MALDDLKEVAKQVFTIKDTIDDVLESFWWETEQLGEDVQIQNCNKQFADYCEKCLPSEEKKKLLDMYSVSTLTEAIKKFVNSAKKDDEVSWNILSLARVLTLWSPLLNQTLNAYLSSLKMVMSETDAIKKEQWFTNLMQKYWFANWSIKITIETPKIEKPESYSPEVQNIMKNISINWPFATIKEVKYEDKIILAATWESPYINKDALPDLIWFALAFHKKTWDALTINSSYRDLDHQEDLHKKYKKWKWNLAAEPWKSGHNLWLSIDIHAGDRYSKQLWWVQWLRDMAKQYNFSPIESEDRHFDHKLFVDMKSTKEDRLALAKKMNDEYKNVA